MKVQLVCGARLVGKAPYNKMNGPEIADAAVRRELVGIKLPTRQICSTVSHGIFNYPSYLCPVQTVSSHSESEKG
ncbi:hypothetical protein RB213_001605 [Colletotrichum asianum]